ncbi:hypothetical protein [Vibrio viridaestus]|uniref:hypothetical protein n=1 Tax=Vibrio viridaestus TaxID=2487322 RepID=UPI00140E20AB|nr:hypothetical protein [Vibrio viridaestus]
MFRLFIIGALSVLMTACVAPFWGPPGGGPGGPGGPHFDGGHDRGYSQSMGDRGYRH